MPPERPTSSILCHSSPRALPVRLAAPDSADPPSENSDNERKLSVAATQGKESSSASKTADRNRKKRGLRGAQSPFAARPLEVKPVFFLPRGESAPTPDESRALADHLAWCQKRYREMLGGRDTFTLDNQAPLVYLSRSSLAELKAAPEMGAPRVVGELFEATKSNRLDCPYVFVVVVMNEADNFPAGGGRPFNGGFNTGGGIVILSSFALGKLPNFQSTLQHELGHAFGLPHIDVYGQDMGKSPSIMSYNPSHHTRGMQPSASPGTLVREDLVGLAINRRAFPNLATALAGPEPSRTARPRLVALGPMTVDGQPAYELAIASESGEAFGTKVANLVQKPILPSAGGRFDATAMWQSAPSPVGVATVIVTFPVPVTLTAVGVHSQHTGVYNAADHMQAQVYLRNGLQLVADSPLQATDALVPIAKPTTAKIWRFSFHAENNKEVTLRGLQFFNRGGELFPPQIPVDNDVGFLR